MTFIKLVLNGGEEILICIEQIVAIERYLVGPGVEYSNIYMRGGHDFIVTMSPVDLMSRLWEEMTEEIDEEIELDA